MSRRVVLGIALTLFALAAGMAAVLVLAEHSTLGLDPDSGKLAIEFALSFALGLGYALGGAVEGWIRGDAPDTWWEALFYRAIAGAVIAFGIIAAGVVALERAGIGPQSGL